MPREPLESALSFGGADKMLNRYTTELAELQRTIEQDIARCRGSKTGIRRSESLQYRLMLVRHALGRADELRRRHWGGASDKGPTS